MWQWILTKILLIDYVRTCSDYWQELNKHRQPLSSAPYIGMIVGNMLVNQIYSSHPVVIIVNKFGNVNFGLTIWAARLIYMFLILSWFPSNYIYHLSRMMDGVTIKHHSIIHPSCSESSEISVVQLKSLKVQSLSKTCWWPSSQICSSANKTYLFIILCLKNFGQYKIIIHYIYKIILLFFIDVVYWWINFAPCILNM